MLQAADLEKFEQAAAIRDRLRAIKQNQSKTNYFLKRE